MTTEISAVEKPEGLTENKKVARRGGNVVTGNARKEAVKELGESVINRNNYLLTEDNIKDSSEE